MENPAFSNVNPFSQQQQQPQLQDQYLMMALNMLKNGQKPQTGPQMPAAPNPQFQGMRQPSAQPNMDMRALMEMMKQRQQQQRAQQMMGVGFDQQAKPGPMSSQGMQPQMAPMYTGLLGADMGATGAAAIPNLGYSGMF